MCIITICGMNENETGMLSKEIAEFAYRMNIDMQIRVYGQSERIFESYIGNIDAIFYNAMNADIIKAVESKGYKGVFICYNRDDKNVISGIETKLYDLQKHQAKKVDTLSEILSHIEKRKKISTILASYRRKKIKIPINDIVTIEHYSKGCELQLKKDIMSNYQDGHIIANYSFKELIVLLKPYGFCLPHYSYIVNMSYISAYDIAENQITVDGRYLDVSRRKCKCFSEEFAKYRLEN